MCYKNNFKTCSITICPADDDCISTSYTCQRSDNDDSCDRASEGFKSNIATGNSDDDRKCCKNIKVSTEAMNLECSPEKTAFSIYSCGNDIFLARLGGIISLGPYKFDLKESMPDEQCFNEDFIRQLIIPDHIKFTCLESDDRKCCTNI